MIFDSAVKGDAYYIERSTRSILRQIKTEQCEWVGNDILSHIVFILYMNISPGAVMNDPCTAS